MEEISSLNSIGGYDLLAEVQEDGSYVLRVLVQGMYCAACIQKIETAIKDMEGVEEARVNFSTQRFVVRWQGQSSLAGDIVQVIEDLGYDVHPYDPQIEDSETRKEERFLLLCLGVAGFAMGNVMLISVGLWSSSVETMGLATREFMHWLSALIAMPVILFSGRPFFRSALKVLSKGHANMDVPISVALLLASGMSLYETIHQGEHVYFDSALMLMFFLLVGRYLDFRARKFARSAATNLLDHLKGFAKVLDGGKIQNIPIYDLQEGMVVSVAAGEIFPADGVVTQGHSEVDTSLITGETVPEGVLEGGRVFAGTLNMAAPLLVQVSHKADKSLLADIAALMEKAEQGQARYVRIADRVARLYTPVVHSMALLAFLGWFFIGAIAWQEAMMIAVTVLIITCPCALGLAVPVVQVLAIGQLMAKGVLVKAGDALERLASIDRVFLDKTGTVTLGRPQLVGNLDDYNSVIVSLAVSLASHSGHVLSKALCSAYEGEIVQLESVQEYPGDGVSALYRGKSIRLGRRAFCGVDEDKDVQHKVMEIWFVLEGEAPVMFVFEDALRVDSKEVVDELYRLGLEVTLLSGDRKTSVEHVAALCRIDNYYAQQKPDDKFRIIEAARAHGECVLMVGDGLNDAPVLAGSDVSIAPGQAIDMAQNAADIVFMGQRLRPVLDSLMTARRAQKLVKQNFILAILYNLFAIPLAVCGLVTPLVAALLMSGSSLIVIANSFRLKFG